MAVWICRWIDCAKFKEADFNTTFYRAVVCQIGRRYYIVYRIFWCSANHTKIINLCTNIIWGKLCRSLLK